MSLRRRARQLQRSTGLTYQQALERLRALGARAAELARQTGWPLEACDRFLVTGEAPIDVVEPVDEVQELLQQLLQRSNAREVTLVELGSLRTRSCRADGEPPAPAPPWNAPRALSRLGPTELVSDDGGGATFATEVRPGALLAIRFDARTSLGLVRLRARQATAELERLLARGGGGGAPLDPLSVS